jgi:hypothetical protein
VAALHGLDAPPVTRCRVLELGCASGGNLIPMAGTLPDCRFVLRLLDGSRDRDTLLRELCRAAFEGTLEFRLNDQPASDTEAFRSALAESLSSCLHRLGKHAPLLG